MTLIKWNPMGSSIFSEIDSLFNSIATDFPTLYERTTSWSPKFEVLNINSAYRIRADLPGMVKKDINIEIVDNTLSISGERVNNSDNTVDDYSEVAYGKFSRIFNLPEDVQENKITASMKDGVLALEIPRVEAVKPEAKKISIK